MKSLPPGTLLKSKKGIMMASIGEDLTPEGDLKLFYAGSPSSFIPVPKSKLGDWEVIRIGYGEGWDKNGPIKKFKNQW